MASCFELRVPKKLLFSLVACSIVLALLEVGQRISDGRKEARRPPEADSPFFETTRGQPITDRRGAVAMTLDPHLLFRPRPNQKTAAVTINAQGFRGKDWKKEKPQGTTRVAFLGGSTAFGLWASSDEKTIPALLENELRKGGGGFEVLNAGVNAFDSLQELVLLESEVLDYSPDVVLFFDGWNDFYNAAHTPKERELIWHKQFEDLETVIERGDQTFRNLLRFSAFYRGLERRFREREESLAARPLEDHPKGAPRYGKDLELAARLALAKGAKVLLVSQPEVCLRGEPRPDEEKRFLESRTEPGYAALALAAYPRYVLAAQEAAKRASVRHDDATKVFDGRKEAFFRDWVHLTDEGNALLAQHLAPLVREALK